MKAAVLYEINKPLVIEDLDLKAPEYGEVLIKMEASGVCHSDWHVIKGDWDVFPLPIVLGHEGAGIVMEVGPDVTSVQPGDHALLAWRAACGLCEMCHQGWPNLCINAGLVGERAIHRGTGKTINQMVQLGTFATHTVVPETAVVAIDKDIPFPQASLVGCGVMTGVGAVMNTARLQPGSSAAVFGCGGVGLNCIQGAALAGATTIIGVDLLESKLERAPQFGATHTVNASVEDPVEAILELTDGNGVHYAFEAIGVTADPFVQTIRCTRRRGVTIWMGHAPVNTPVTIDARDLMQEKMVMGSMYGSARPRVDFPRLLNLYKSGRLKLDELITRRYLLDDVNDAITALANGEVARSVLTFS